MIKSVLGYDIVQGVTTDQYEEWLWKVHVPDRLANPNLDRIVLNTVIHSLDARETVYRVAELHFGGIDAYHRYLQWNTSHPVPDERSSRGRTDHRFQLLCDAHEVGRQQLSAWLPGTLSGMDWGSQNRNSAGVKEIVGWDLARGVRETEHEDWLWGTFCPHLLASPFLDGVVLDTVIRPLRGDRTFHRILELCFRSAEQHQKHLNWQAAHPRPDEDRPDKQVYIRLRLLCHVQEVDRDFGPLGRGESDGHGSGPRRVRGE